MIAPIRLAHLVFRTRDMERMKNWYCNVLNAHMVNGNENIAFLTYDDEHHRIALIANKDFKEKSDDPAIGFYHVAFTYAGLSELLAHYDELSEIGIEPWRAINHGPTISLYYKDPDGNDVELQVDRFEDARDAQEWMKGEAFTNNPIGIEIEIEDLRNDLATGKPFEEIMRRADEVH